MFYICDDEENDYRNVISIDRSCDSIEKTLLYIPPRHIFILSLLWIPNFRSR
ncbi:hypothetical protein Igag_1881 [Ignisphaera aggregans DSM 17230]|uniref:Uncharacterized protein n=1 Tax=Ignisphaera aggregans (strain DSM 17230 / JCM 13409 / AQ1.S1) TaxID=583356 RepID=E0ST14_IGNAA|nr:hypothetical protein Igag_1881 [Ignisphaera aggregans DSM 17230]